MHLQAKVMPRSTSDGAFLDDVPGLCRGLSGNQSGAASGLIPRFSLLNSKWSVVDPLLCRCFGLIVASVIG